MSASNVAQKWGTYRIGTYWRFDLQALHPRPGLPTSEKCIEGLFIVHFSGFWHSQKIKEKAPFPLVLHPFSSRLYKIKHSTDFYTVLYSPMKDHRAVSCSNSTTSGALNTSLSIIDRWNTENPVMFLVCNGAMMQYRSAQAPTSEIRKTVLGMICQVRHKSSWLKRTLSSNSTHSISYVREILYRIDMEGKRKRSSSQLQLNSFRFRITTTATTMIVTFKHVNTPDTSLVKMLPPELPLPLPNEPTLASVLAKLRDVQYLG